MTEEGWLSSDDPVKMYRFLTENIAMKMVKNNLPPTLESRKPSDRKLRLFACACCRQVWGKLQEDRHRKAVEAAEKFADGEITEAEIFRFGDAANDAGFQQFKWAACVCTVTKNYPDFSRQAAESSRLDPNEERQPEQAALLRDVVGNPFRPVVLPYVPDGGEYHAYTPAGRLTRSLGKDKWEYADYCPWLTPQVLSLAQAAYEDRPGRKCEQCKWPGTEIREGYDAVQAVIDWGRRKKDCPDCRGTGRIDDATLDPVRLMVLADALEEAGCPVEAADEFAFGGVGPHPLLVHLRSPGVHVRGCWALDIILGK